MWSLYLLPSWYVHIIPISGLAIIVASMFLKVIPLVNTYHIPIKILGFVLLFSGIFLEGGMFVNREWAIKMQEMQDKIAVAETMSKEENVKIVEKIVVKKEYYREKGKDIVKYIDREIIKYDDRFAPGGQCEIPKEFIEAVNKAAKDVK